MSIENKTITFIGGGNMATALIGGLVGSGVDPQHIRVGEPDANRRKMLQTDFGVVTSDDNPTVIAGADAIVLAVKPQIFPTIADTLADLIAVSQPLVLSIAAGITTATLSDWLGGATAIVRVMPNTPALVGCGMAGLFATATVTPAQRDTAAAIIGAASEILWVENENLIDAVTAVSGSGPAYFFLVMELMQQIAVELGLDADAARKLVLQTALGAATMAKQSDVDVAELRRRVTSPGGTTAAALNEFEQGDLKELVRRALTAARDRGRELS